MKHTYFTVGPSQIYKSVPMFTKNALKEDIFSLNHRGDEFQALYKNTVISLKKLLNIPETHSIFFLSSGTEAMERVIQNGVENISGHIVSGSFGKRFYETAGEMGKRPVQLSFHEQGESVQMMKFAEDVELIAVTQNDTSTGYHIPMEHIYQLGNRHPDALIALDTVSSMPYIHIDYTKIDYVFFSVQKGFGLPAGLGIIVVSPRALEKARVLHTKGVAIGSYHNFLQLQEFYEKYQTPETPNVFGIYLLNKVIHDFLHIGISHIRSCTEQKMELMYGFFENHSSFRPVIDDPQYRSFTTLVVEVKNGSTKLVQDLKKRGFSVGTGYGDHKDRHVRIANFPAHTVRDVKKLLRNIEEIM